LDTWNSIRNALVEADKNKKRVVQIPMIRLVEPQSSDLLNGMTTLDEIVLNPHLSNGALAEAQIAFRRDLLPHGFTPYDTRSGYGVHNKLDMLSLCGENIWWNFDVVVGGPRLALLSQFWNASMCYCSEEVRHRAQEVWDWHHKFGLLPGVHDEKWVQATAPFRKKNLPIARHCGLWTRLFPWPDPKGVAQAVSTFSKKQRSRDKYCTASRSSASLVEDTRCRGDIRTYAKHLFDIQVSDRCARPYVVDDCQCSRNGLETACHTKSDDYDVNVNDNDRCQVTCCDPSLNFRLGVRNVVERQMTNEHINQCWCEWANTETCRFKDGSRCHGICCNHLKKSIQHDESKMEHLLDYLDSIHHHNTNELVQEENQQDGEDEYDPSPQCDCGWANRKSCRHDDGTVCHYVCCPRRRSSKHMSLRKRHMYRKKKQHKTQLTFVEELRAMLRKCWALSVSFFHPSFPVYLSL